MHRKADQGTESFAHENPLTMWMAPDSRTVATEVGIRQGVCNNSPAEAIRSENGQCYSKQPLSVRSRLQDYV